MTKLSLRPAALLLLGPTGVGKTPLGDLIEARGLFDRRRRLRWRCVHFDFGRRLRAVARGTDVPAGVGRDGVAAVVRALEAGALLEDGEFWVARAILADFLARTAAGPDDLVVLNGLPRHLGQARDVDRIVDVRAVLRLKASHTVLRDRIRLDTGGDRGERTDDDDEKITARIERYEQRTLPLLEHYGTLGAASWTVRVGRETGAEEAYAALRDLAARQPAAGAFD